MVPILFLPFNNKTQGEVIAANKNKKVEEPELIMTFVKENEGEIFYVSSSDLANSRHASINLNTGRGNYENLNGGSSARNSVNNNIELNTVSKRTSQTVIKNGKEEEEGFYTS